MHSLKKSQKELKKQSTMPKIINKQDVLNFPMVGEFDKIVFVNVNMEVNWIEKSAIIVDIKSKQQRLAYDETIINFTREQLPRFKYKFNQNEFIIIRGKNRSCVYVPKNPPSDGLIFHPHAF